MLPRVIFFGTPDFAAQGLRALLTSGVCEVRAVVTQPDRPAGRGHTLQGTPVKELALQQGCAVLQPGSIRKEEAAFLNAARELGPFELGVVIAFGQILPPTVLSLARYGCLNVHASLLPRWRGAAPIQRAILAGDTETGICLMQLEPGLDTGPVFAKAPWPITAQDTFGTLHDALATAGGQLLVEQLPKIVAGSVTAVAQPEVGITYAAKISNSESQIDWHETAVAIDRRIRAFAPAPGAFTTLGGKRIKIFSSEPLDESKLASTTLGSTSLPGTICDCTADTLIVRCGAGALRLRELQLEGKKRLGVKEFLRGYPLSTNMNFG